MTTSQIKLSKRLQAICDLVSQDNVVADIGSDHALLPIALVNSGKVTRAYASEVNEGPYDMTVRNIEKYNLTNYVIPVLSDGISELQSDVTTVTICGMGGNLISDILSSHSEKLKNVKEIILQPNNNEETARIWLANNGWNIVEEEIVEEDDVYYEIIKARKEEEKKKYTKQELYFGPILMEKKSPEFIGKWTKHREYLKKIVSGIENHELYNYKMLVSMIDLIDWVLG